MKTTIYATTLALVAATPAFAQSDPDIVVTASRSGEGIPIDRLGASVTLLDAATIDARQTRAVSDVLRDVPGVAVSRTIGGPTQIRLRGTEANHVLMLIDGVEAKSVSITGRASLVVIPLDVPVGRTTVTWRSDIPVRIAPGDPRQVSLMVSGVQFIDD